MESGCHEGRALMHSSLTTAYRPQHQEGSLPFDSATSRPLLGANKNPLPTASSSPVISSCVCACSVTSVSSSLQAYGLQLATLLCPWDPPGKNTGVGCYILLQGTFPTQTQGSNLSLLHLLHCSWILYPLSHLGSPPFLPKT